MTHIRDFDFDALSDTQKAYFKNKAQYTAMMAASQIAQMKIMLPLKKRGRKKKTSKRRTKSKKKTSMKRPKKLLKTCSQRTRMATVPKTRRAPPHHAKYLASGVTCKGRDGRIWTVKIANVAGTRRRTWVAKKAAGTKAKKKKRSSKKKKKKTSRKKRSSKKKKKRSSKKKKKRSSKKKSPKKLLKACSKASMMTTVPKSRRAPAHHARFLASGVRCKGVDGRMWTVKVAKVAGTKRRTWVAMKSGVKKSSSKKKKKTSRKKRSSKKKRKKTSRKKRSSKKKKKASRKKRSSKRKTAAKRPTKLLKSCAASAKMTTVPKTRKAPVYHAKYLASGVTCKGRDGRIWTVKIANVAGTRRRTWVAKKSK